MSGIQFDTFLPLHASSQPQSSPLEVLAANAVELKPMGEWVQRSADRLELDDYGTLKLFILALDGMDMTVVSGRQPARAISQCARKRRWTAEERLLAIGGGLRSLGFEVALFEARGGDLVLGLGTRDAGLNVYSIQQTWTLYPPEGARQTTVEWVMWDGKGRLGRLDRLGGDRVMKDIRQLNPRPPSKALFEFSERTLPAFATRQSHLVKIPVPEARTNIRLRSYPDVATWLDLFPAHSFEYQARYAREEASLLGLGPSVRHVGMKIGREKETIDAILRAYQRHFVYKVGPLRSTLEVVEEQTGDCDQLSMLMAITLRELGYVGDAIRAVRWQDHLTLAVRPARGEVQGTGVTMNDDRYVLLDVTHYVYENGLLASRWGAVADDLPKQVQVITLPAL